MHDEQLSPHFRLSEFVRSDTARRLGISNIPNIALINRLRLVAWMGEHVRSCLDDWPINVTSGWRGAVLNKAVGGSDTSDHLDGWCFDFRCPKFGTPFEIVARLEQRDLPFDQLINEQEKGIVHISFAPALRGQILTQRGASFIGGNHRG